jgi:hypothetical protein
MDLSETEILVYKLLRQFADRQHIVLKIMEELHPDKLYRLKTKDSEEVNAFFSLVVQCASVPQGGYWGENNEWEYFFHGWGCRLTHTLTGEPIEWDAPDLMAIDIYWFRNHLQWLLDQETDLELVVAFRELIGSDSNKLEALLAPIVQRLCEKGALLNDRMYYVRYTLLLT